MGSQYFAVPDECHTTVILKKTYSNIGIILICVMFLGEKIKLGASVYLKQRR